MSNNTYKKLIKYGNILDHYLVDFPQHILTTEQNMYAIEINKSLTFVLNIPEDVSNYVFCLPLVNVDSTQYKYNCSVEWGDGTISKIKSIDDINKSHIYVSGGIYYVSIVGDCYGFNNKLYYEKPINGTSGHNYWEYLTDIIDWGNLDLSLLDYRIL